MWKAARHRTAPQPHSVLRLVHGRVHPEVPLTGKDHHARMASIAAASSREAATSSGSLRSAMVSARNCARRCVRSASRMAARAASDRDCPPLVNAANALSTSGSVRIVSVPMCQKNVLQNARWRVALGGHHSRTVGHQGDRERRPPPQRPASLKRRQHHAVAAAQLGATRIRFRYDLRQEEDFGCLSPPPSLWIRRFRRQ